MSSLATAEAKSKNTQADEWMLQKNYVNALHLFSGAIAKCPNEAKYYANRSRCYLLMNEFLKAQKDAEKCIAIDANYLKGYTRLIKCFLATGDLRFAEVTIQNAKIKFPSDKDIENILVTVKYIKKEFQLCELKLERKMYEEALQLAENCIAITPNCLSYIYVKIKCLILLQRFAEVEQIATEILKFKPSDEDAAYYQCCAKCYRINAEDALQLIRKLKQKLPDHEKTNQLLKNTRAICDNISTSEMLIKNSKYTDAYKIIQNTIKLDENYVRTNRRLRLYKIDLVEKGMKNDDLLWNGVLDCTEYLRLYGFDLNILKKRAHLLMLIQEYEDAIEDFKNIIKLDNSFVYKDQLESAEKLFLKEASDEYKILKISSNATTNDIKKAAIKLVKRYHPDKHANVSPERVKQLEERFMRMRKAEETLLSRTK